MFKFHETGELDTMIGLNYTGVDFKMTFMNVGEKKLKLTVWDTGEMCLHALE